MARTGDREAALRIYAAMAELNPNATRIHLRLAQAFKDLKKYRAAAGHFKAAATSAKGKPRDMLDYLFALAITNSKELLQAEIQSVLADGKFRSIHKKLTPLMQGFELNQLPPWSKRTYRGKLTVKLELSRPEIDLDLALVDPYGRQISGLWRLGASSTDLPLGGMETLSLHALINGRYTIRVHRTDKNANEPVTGRVSIRVMNQRRTIPFTLTQKDQTVAEVTYKRQNFKW